MCLFVCRFVGIYWCMCVSSFVGIIIYHINIIYHTYMSSSSRVFGIGVERM